MSQKMLKIAPHASRLKEIHKNDAKRLQQETAKLYKEHGVNPALGCLPMLIQLPIIWGLYNMLFNIVSLNPHIAVKKINSVLYSQSLHISGNWNPQFFGIPLGQTPEHLFATMGPLILLVPVITGALQFVQTKMMTPPKNKAVSTEKKQDDFASAFQTQSLYIFPIMIGFFSFNFSFGLSLYWNTFTIFGILQQYLIKKEDKEKGVVVAPIVSQNNRKRNK
jgi:YidC/Oxa1 family membrane protein insertase